MKTLAYFDGDHLPPPEPPKTEWFMRWYGRELAYRLRADGHAAIATAVAEVTKAYDIEHMQVYEDDYPADAVAAFRYYRDLLHPYYVERQYLKNTPTD